MAVKHLDNALDRLVEVTRRVAEGNLSDVETLLTMAGDRALPPKVALLAETIGMLVVQVEARQFHLNCTFADLERTQTDLERANYDGLTGLPNRVIFQDRLRKAVARANADGHAMAVLFVDLDRFKAVNDRLGHDAGDELLRVVAARLQGCVRGNDVVSRLGGDEFTVVMPSVASDEDATDIAKRIVTSLSRPFHLNAGEALIGASVGIALLPDHADTPEKLLKSADMAMYRAKEGGRNGYVVFGDERPGPDVCETTISP